MPGERGPAGGSVVISGGEVTQSGSILGTTAALVILPSSDQETAIAVQAPDDAWGDDSNQPYGDGQAFILYRAGTGTPNSRVLFRISSNGGFGVGGGTHLATGLNQPPSIVSGWASSGIATCWADHKTGPAPTYVVGFAESRVAGQTGLDIQITNANNHNVFTVTPTNTGLDAAMSIGTDTNSGVIYMDGNGAAYSAHMWVASQAAGNTALILKGAASQTAPLLNAETSAGASVFQILPSGQFKTAAANEATTATAGTIASPGNFAGFLSFQDHTGTVRKIPYFAN